MKSTGKNSLHEQLESVFKECRSNIDQAVKEYERDIHSALESLKNDLSRPQRRFS